MGEHKRSKGFIFEGEALENYKNLRDRWVMLTIIGSALPLLLTCIISWYCGKLQFIELLGKVKLYYRYFRSQFRCCLTCLKSSEKKMLN